MQDVGFHLPSQEAKAALNSACHVTMYDVEVRVAT